ncbi:MAG: hypothetical protein U1A27_07865 [Phycisphaerae bacterium]
MELICGAVSGLLSAVTGAQDFLNGFFGLGVLLAPIVDVINFFSSVLNC